MQGFFRLAIAIVVCVFPVLGEALIQAGIGKAEITPPIGTPSAGYTERKGEGIRGVHDPLLSIALYLESGDRKIVLCSVDHLGFNYEMIQNITRQVKAHPGLADCEVYVGSSHTHSGGGAHLNIPGLGAALAGPYNPEIEKLYIDKTVESILSAFENQISGKVGIGYGEATRLSFFRASWPKGIVPVPDIVIIKVTDLNDQPLAILFNYAVHPVVLRQDNRLFSADFVGYARDHLKDALGPDLQAMYFNGAQGDIDPLIANPEDRFDTCDQFGLALAGSIKKIWDATETSDELEIDTFKESYSFAPQTTPFGLALPIPSYETEMNLIVLNRSHAFVTIPGELSCLYDREFKVIGSKLGFKHVSILGLTNDAHGYIISPDAWRHKTYESALSFGGERYGEETEKRATALLKAAAP